MLYWALQSSLPQPATSVWEHACSGEVGLHSRSRLTVDPRPRTSALTSLSIFLIAALPNTEPLCHVGLLKFKLNKMKLKIEFFATPATFQRLTVATIRWHTYRTFPSSWKVPLNCTVSEITQPRPSLSLNFKKIRPIKVNDFSKNLQGFMKTYFLAVWNPAGCRLS